MKIVVKVKPGSRQQKVVRSGDELTVWVHARAHDGEANKEVVKMLAAYFGVAKSCVVILRGATSRTKTVELVGR